MLKGGAVASAKRKAAARKAWKTRRKKYGKDGVPGRAKRK